MKRVYLNEVGRVEVGGRLVATPQLLRYAAVLMAQYLCGGGSERGVGSRKTGDPVHTWVTEGRRKQYEDALKRRDAWAVKMSKTGGYSDCGDLCNALPFLLGCRDEKYMNRTGDGGSRPWTPGDNLNRLRTSAAAVLRGRGRAPKEGDIGYSPQYGGHVYVFGEALTPETTEVLTYDYGQGDPEDARIKLKSVKYDPQNGLYTVNGHPTEWWVDIERIPLTESAIVLDVHPGTTEMLDTSEKDRDLWPPSEEGGA